MEEYLIGIGIKRAVVAAVGFLTTQEALVILAKYGVHVDSEVLKLALGAAAVAGWHWLHDFLKVKVGIDWL